MHEAMNQRIATIKDFFRNSNQSLLHRFFYTVFDRIRFITGVRPDYGQRYFLRLQMIRTTIVAKSRRLSKWSTKNA